MSNTLGKAARMMASFVFCASLGAAALMPEPKRLAVREVELKPDAAAPFLSRPVAVVCDEGSVYVLDSADADIKIYSRDGVYRRAIGRKGQGPGEFRLPNDLDVFGGRLYVADSANRRLQILDAGGEHVGGFPLGMTPWRILFLSDDRILVAGLPSGRAPDEKIINCFRGDGTPVWRAVESLRSGDAVLDALRNQVFIKRAPGGGFRVIRCFDDRIVRTMNAYGLGTGEAATPEASLPLKKIEVLTSGGQKKSVKGFCWSCAADGRRLFILSPEFTDDHDLGPGKAIAVFGDTMELEALIELPENITRFAVAGDTIYAIDTDSRLRIFVIEPPLAAQVRLAASLEEAAVPPYSPAVLVFFSLDCPVCWEELFEVRYIVEKNTIPIALVGISADSREALEPFLAKHAFFHPVVCDRGRELFRKFRVKLEPLTVVIDGGRVIHRDNTAEGMDIRREKLKQCLLEITARRPS